MTKQAQHTPDHVHNPSSCCSCEIEFNGKATTIVYCSKHKAAPELLIAARNVLSVGNDNLGVQSIDWNRLRVAIAAAEGRPETTDQDVIDTLEAKKRDDI